MPDPAVLDRVDVVAALLTIEGVIDRARISALDGGLEAQTELNSDPRQPSMMQLGPTHFANVVFRRPWKRQDELKQWRDDTARGSARAKTGELRLIDREGVESHIIELRGVWLSRWKLDLRLLESGPAHEEVEIAVEGWQIS